MVSAPPKPQPKTYIKWYEIGGAWLPFRHVDGIDYPVIRYW